MRTGNHGTGKIFPENKTCDQNTVYFPLISGRIDNNQIEFRKRLQPSMDMELQVFCRVVIFLFWGSDIPSKMW